MIHVPTPPVSAGHTIPTAVVQAVAPHVRLATAPRVAPHPQARLVATTAAPLTRPAHPAAVTPVVARSVAVVTPLVAAMSQAAVTQVVDTQAVDTLAVDAEDSVAVDNQEKAIRDPTYETSVDFI